MAKTKPTTENLIRQRRKEIEKLIIENETKAAFYRNELEALDDVLARINKDPLSAQQGQTRRELVYQYLKKNSKGTFTEILRHFHPAGLDPKKAQGIRSGFDKALRVLIESGAIKKVMPGKNKRGISYIFNK
jgi:hypothetical protein